MEKNKLIVGNHKTYMDASQINDYLQKIIGNIKTDDVIICPSSIFIPYFLKHRYSVGIQNVCADNNFDLTGEVTANQAASLGIKYSIVGHSERRINYYEDNNTINQKINRLIENNMKAIVCIGETNEEKNLFKTKKILKNEIVTCLKNFKPENFENIMIAYEPIWSIGTNRIPTMAEIKNNVKYIKEIVKKIYDVEVKVLYGGSVSSSNIEKLNKIECLDGFLVGSKSTDADEFLKIIEVVVNQ